LWSFWLSSINLRTLFLLRLCWYNLITRWCHWSYFWSINLLSWDWLRLYRNINNILNLSSYFWGGFRHIIIFLTNFGNFRLTLNFNCRRRWKLWCDYRILLNLYIFLIRININSVFDCLKDCIIRFKWRCLTILYILNNSLNLIIIFLSKISCSNIPRW
jgi:hypothetical protein